MAWQIILNGVPVVEEDTKEAAAEAGIKMLDAGVFGTYSIKYKQSEQKRYTLEEIEDAGELRREKVKKLRETDEWASPSEGNRWLCPDSVTGFCWYDWDEHGEDCVGCGHPEERK